LKFSDFSTGIPTPKRVPRSPRPATGLGIASSSAFFRGLPFLATPGAAWAVRAGGCVVMRTSGDELRFDDLLIRRAGLEQVAVRAEADDAPSSSTRIWSARTIVTSWATITVTVRVTGQRRAAGRRWRGRGGEESSNR
jgi:hypothetical protein